MPRWTIIKFLPISITTVLPMYFRSCSRLETMSAQGMKTMLVSGAAGDGDDEFKVIKAEIVNEKDGYSFEVRLNGWIRWIMDLNTRAI